MAVVPSPVRRVLRDRPRLVAIALLALVSLAAAGINVTAADRLQSMLDANWRGAYDILVTAGDAEMAGLLPPNSLAAGPEGMTLEDLGLIRSVDGVEVAAPIGEVIVPALSSKQERISLPLGAAGANQQPQAFRVTITRHTDDGLGERLVSSEVFELVVDETEQPQPEQPCTFDGLDVDPEKYPLLTANCDRSTSHSIISYQIDSGTMSGGDVVGDTVLFNLGAPVQPITRVTLVDPVAEHVLLGEAGEFLAPLEQLSPNGPASEDTISAWEQLGANQFSRDFAEHRKALKALAWDYTGFFDELKHLHEENGSAFDVPVWPQYYVPLVVRETPPAPLTATIEVEAFGPAPRPASLPSDFSSIPYQLPAELRSGERGEALGSVTVDASALLNPFSSSEVRVPWPGTSSDVSLGQVSPYGMNIFSLGSAQAPEFFVSNPAIDSVEVELRAGGYLAPFYRPRNGPNDMVAVEGDGTVMGMESAYASNIQARAINGEAGFTGVAVGGFSLQGVDELQSRLNRAPLGAYDAIGSTLIPGSSEDATSAIELNPSVSGLGLVSPETVAIASIDSVVAMGETAPINAVRVRVADVDSFSSAGIATIADTAEELEKLGFTATMVAGSSPTDVTVHVDGYAFGVTAPGEEQRIGSLGAVNQRWSELGAAARADLAVSVSTLTVLAVALAASALLLAAVQLASVPGRRAQASVMRTVGWRRRRIVRWMAAEELMSLIVVAVAGVAALALSGGRPSVMLVIGASLAALVVTSALAVLLGALPAPKGMPRLSLTKKSHGETELSAWVTSALRLSLRQLTVHWVGAVVQLLATVVVAVASSAVAVTILEGRAAAGASALAGFALDRAFISQAGLGAVALVAGVVLAVIARRIDLGSRREQWAAMQAMGFSSWQLRHVQLTDGLLIGVPSIAVAGAAAWVYLGTASAQLRESILPTALVAAAALTVILMVTYWREKR